MKPKQIFVKLILATATFLAAWWIVVSVSTKCPVGSWFSIMIGVLSAAFLVEAIKSADGQKVFWATLSTRDKLIVFVDFLAILLFGLYPLKMGLPLGFAVIFVIFGYGVAWFITKVFGSNNLRRIFWLHRKRSQDS